MSRRRVGRARVAAVAVVASLVLSWVVASGPAGARAKPRVTTTTTTTTWPPLPRFDDRVSWSDCGAGFQCGTLAVPVDWSVPSGGTLPLALIRRPAESPAERIGALLINYGGPGQSGIDYLRNTWQGLPDALRARFDLVTFDPRGVGQSRPVDCVDDAFLDLGSALPAVPTDTAQLDAIHQYNAAFARGCAERNGAYAGQVGTRNVARDLDGIRLALGEAKITYLGFSYGTIVGITYAQMFPDSIRAMVLDGPPDYWLSTRDSSYAQAQGFMRALDAFLSWCDQTHCALASEGAARDALNGLIAKVDQAPLDATYTTNGTTRTGRLTGSLLQSGTIAMLYDKARGWPALADGLSTAAHEGWGGPLLMFADNFLRRDPSGTWSSLVESNAVIACVDRPATKVLTTAQEEADIAKFQRELPPWGGGWGVESCVGMPKPARGDRLGDVRVAHAPPILVVGTTGDPATPYTGAQAMLTRIAGSRLLTYDSTEHTAYGTGRSTCIDEAVDAYLFDGTLPADGTHCAAG